MKPVEIEFLMRDRLSPGLDKNRQKTEALMDVAREAGDVIIGKINQQRKVIDNVTSALESMEHKLAGIRPGHGMEDLAADIAACRKLLDDEVASLDALEREYMENARSLEQLERKYQELSAAAQQATDDVEDNSDVQEQAGIIGVRLTARLRELQDAMARMRLAGQQNSEEYRQMATEAANLSDTIGDLREQTKVLSSDDANLQGLVSGISGLSGAVTAATGAISLFAGENENLAKIQTRVQSIMAVSMGLQQVFNTLNRDSAFQLVTVARAKSLLATATKGLATALNISNTAAKALMGTLTLGLSVAVSGLIYLWDKYTDAQQQAVEKARELAKVESNARAERIRTRFEIDAVRKSIEGFTGSKEEERKKVDELNSKYGETFGYYDSVSQWYDKLTEKSEKYAETLFLQAKMQALVNKAVEMDAELAEIEAAGPDAFRNWRNAIYDKLHGTDSAKAAYDAALWQKRHDRDKVLNEASEIQQQIDQIRISSDIGGHKSPTTNTTHNGNDANQLSAELLERQRRNQQAEIDLMAEGSAKKREQLRHDYELEIAELDALETKWREKQNGNLTKEQNDALEAARSLASIRRGSGEEDIRIEEGKAQQEKLEAARQAWQQYYIEYGTFEEKRVALAQEYADRIVKAETEGEKASLQKQLDEKIQGLGYEEFKASINFADIFGNLELQSTEALSQLRNKLRDYINRAASDLRPQDLKELQDAVERIDFKIDMRLPFQSLAKELKAYQSAQNGVAKAQKDLNTVISGGEVVTGIYTDESGKLVKVSLTQEQAEKNLTDAQEKRNRVQQALAKSVAAVGARMKESSDAANQIAGVLENDFGIQLGEDIHNIIDGFGEMTEGVTSFGEALASGNIAGAIGSVVQTAGGLVKTVGSVFGADWGGQKSIARYEAAKAEYESYMNVLDRVIDKQLELVATMSSTDYLNAGNSYEYAKSLVGKQETAARNLGVQYLNSGASKGFLGFGSSASRGTKQREGISDEAWGEYNRLKTNTTMLEQLGLSATTLANAASERMTGLFSLSANQLEYIMTNAPTFWAQLHDDTRMYLEQIISCGDELEKMHDARDLSLTGVTFDEFYSNWKSRILDMDSDAKDLSENIEGYFRDAFLGNLLDEKYKVQVKALYERWADMSESEGNITDAEIEALRLERDELARQMIAERNQLADIFGWMPEDTAATVQTGKTGGFNAMTQDQGTKLEGMFTTGLMHWASIDRHVEDVAGRMSETAECLAHIKEDTGSCRESLSSIKTGLDMILRDGVKMQ